MIQSNHKERAHSKFSASGSERWLNCAASVELEESMPKDKNYDSFWSLEGTAAHEVLESFLLSSRWSDVYAKYEFDLRVDEAMLEHCRKCAVKVKTLARDNKAPILVEKKVFNTFIHDEMFGTCDVIIPVYGKTLHILDFKYGQGKIVSPVDNTQLIQYALGAAESYGWELQFEKVALHILQPRAGKDPDPYIITMYDLKNKWLPLWEKGVARIVRGGNKPFPGSHCYWCKAKSKCPARIEKSFNDITNAFNETPLPEGNDYGKKEKGYKKESSQKSKSKSKRKNPFEETEGLTEKEIEESGPFGFGDPEESGTDGWGGWGG